MKNLKIVKLKAGNDYFLRNFNYYNLNKPDKNIRKLIKTSKIKPKSILEIGCANGAKLYQYSKLLKTKKNYGIDVSNKAILDGKKKYKNLNLLKLSSLEINKIKIKFDLIICGFFLYLLDREELFRQFDLIYKKIKEDGYLIILDFESSKKQQKKNIHNINLKTYKMSYINFLKESGLFELIYKKKYNNEKDIYLTLYKKKFGKNNS